MGEVDLHGERARKFWANASQLTLENTGYYAQNAKEKERRKQQSSFVKMVKYYMLCGMGKSSEEYKLQRKVETELHKYVDSKHKHADMFGDNEAMTMQWQRPEDALSYTLNERTTRWEVETMLVRVSRKHFAQGGMRKCYRGGIILENGLVSPCVFKVFFKRVKPTVMFNEVLTQVVSSNYARAWNSYLQQAMSNHPRAIQKLMIVFLPVSVVQFPERKASGKGSFATMEPFLKYTKDYEKLNDNYGRHLHTRKATIAQAFSYFTFVKSKGYLMVCDIQGVERIFTDPQVHSVDKDLFGSGNLGVSGMNQFFTNFHYSKLCQRLGLPPPSELEKELNAATLKASAKVLESVRVSNAEMIDLDKLDAEEDNEEFEEQKHQITEFATRIKAADPFQDGSKIRTRRASTKKGVEEVDILELVRKRSSLARPNQDRETAVQFRNQAVAAIKRIVERNPSKRRKSSNNMNIAMLDPIEISRLTRRSTMVMIEDKDLDEIHEYAHEMEESRELETKTEDKEEKEEEEDDDEVDVEKFQRDFQAKKAPKPSSSPPYKVHGELQKVTLSPKISP